MWVIDAGDDSVMSFASMVTLIKATRMSNPTKGEDICKHRQKEWEQQTHTLHKGGRGDGYNWRQRLPLPSQPNQQPNVLFSIFLSLFSLLCQIIVSVCARDDEIITPGDTCRVVERRERDRIDTIDCQHGSLPRWKADGVQDTRQIQRMNTECKFSIPFYCFTNCAASS